MTSRPDLVLDAALCSDSQGVVMKGPEGHELTAFVVSLRRSFPDVPIVLEVSQQSWDSLDAVREKALSGDLARLSNIASVDPVSERVVISVKSEDSQAVAAARAVESPLITVRTVSGLGVSSTVYGDRNSDYEPFQAGGIVTPSGCSLGPRVRISGQEMLLTAGHCGPGPYRTGSGTNVEIGVRHTTSYPGNSDIYGDWQLIKGKDYSDWVFSGSPYNDTSSLRGTGLNTTWRARGVFLCSSGMTTGQWCRARIVNVDVQVTLADLTYGNVTTGKLYSTIQDNGDPTQYGRCLYTGQNGEAPDGYDRGGDSGGAVYHSNGTTPNTVTYDGLVTGQSWEPGGLAGWKCWYHYTSLVGVKAWNSGVSW